MSCLEAAGVTCACFSSNLIGAENHKIRMTNKAFEELSPVVPSAPASLLASTTLRMELVLPANMEEHTIYQQSKVELRRPCLAMAVIIKNFSSRPGFNCSQDYGSFWDIMEFMVPWNMTTENWHHMVSKHAPCQSTCQARHPKKRRQPIPKHRRLSFIASQCARFDFV